jgi:putative transposase
MREVNSLNHTRWECKYHIVFIPKYRRKVLFGQIRKEMGEVFHRLAGQKESLIEEGHLMHITRAYDDIDSAKICGVSGGWFYQREECDPYSAAVRWQETELCWAALLGSRLFCIDSGSR